MKVFLCHYNIDAKQMIDRDVCNAHYGDNRVEVEILQAYRPYYVLPWLCHCAVSHCCPFSMNNV